MPTPNKKTVVAINPVAMRLFWYWIQERYQMWVRRFLEHKTVLTDDPILRDYRFTNVFRDLDRGTVWLFEKIIRYSPTYDAQLVFNIIAYRLINRPTTLMNLPWGYPYVNKNWGAAGWKRFEEGLREIADTDPVFGSAYIIRAGGPGSNKIRETVKRLRTISNSLPWLYDILLDKPNLRDYWEALCKLPGIGGFIGYEIATDLTYTPFGCFTPDYLQDSWCNAGPGAKRGLRRIFSPAPPTSPLGSAMINLHLTDKAAQVLDTPEDFIYYLCRNQECLLQRFFSGTPFSLTLDVRAIEHSLCEFSKYCTGLEGQVDRRIKRRYVYRPQEELIPADGLGSEQLGANAHARLFIRLEDKAHELARRNKQFGVSGSSAFLPASRMESEE